MRNYLIIFLLFIPFLLHSQKVKYKNNAVYIDKEHSFDFIKTQKAGLMETEYANFLLKDKKGNIKLAFGDTLLYYSQNPNEKSPRAAIKLMTVHSPEINRTQIIPRIISITIRKLIVHQLKKGDFFSTGVITEKNFDAFLELQNMKHYKDWVIKIDTTSQQRTKNYELSADKFGPLIEREPTGIYINDDFEIYENKIQLGKIVPEKKGSYAQIFVIINNDKRRIGHVTIFQKENKANVCSRVNDKFHFFNNPLDRHGQATLTEYDKIKMGVRYLVTHGYL